MKNCEIIIMSAGERLFYVQNNWRLVKLGKCNRFPVDSLKAAFLLEVKCLYQGVLNILKKL